MLEKYYERLEEQSRVLQTFLWHTKTFSRHKKKLAMVKKNVKVERRSKEKLPRAKIPFSSLKN